jgi:hypothetical protein
MVAWGSTQPLDVVIVERAEVSHSHGQHSSVHGSRDLLSRSIVERNYSGPVERSLLHAPGSMRGVNWVPPDDYFGIRRTLPPVRGAIQARTGAIELGPRP